MNNLQETWKKYELDYTLGKKLQTQILHFSSHLDGTQMCGKMFKIRVSNVTLCYVCKIGQTHFTSDSQNFFEEWALIFWRILFCWIAPMCYVFYAHVTLPPPNEKCNLKKNSSLSFFLYLLRAICKLLILQSLWFYLEINTLFDTQFSVCDPGGEEWGILDNLIDMFLIQFSPCIHHTVSTIVFSHGQRR